MRRIEYKKQIGFTLIELMIVVVIAGILLGIGIPSYNTLRNNNCLVTNANRLVATLQYARSEAAKRNASVSVRARNGSWRFGFEIVTNEVDADGNGTCTGVEDHDNNIINPNQIPAATTPGTCDTPGILKVIELGCFDAINPAQGLQITHTTLNPAPPAQSLTYRSSGRISATALGGIFNICMANFLGTNRARQTRVSSIGRPQTNTTTTFVCPMAGF